MQAYFSNNFLVLTSLSSLEYLHSSLWTIMLHSYPKCEDTQTVHLVEHRIWVPGLSDEKICFNRLNSPSHLGEFFTSLIISFIVSRQDFRVLHCLTHHLLPNSLHTHNNKRILLLAHHHNMTAFAKTRHNSARTEIHFIA